MRTLHWRLLFAAALALFALSIPIAARADCDPGFDGGSIEITGGTADGQALDPADPRVLVTGGGTLTGTVSLQVENHGGASDVFPVCATPSWGDHATSGWSIDDWLHNPPGAESYDVAIDLDVPTTPGTYFVFFAAAWELDCGNVLSCTNWAYAGGDQWNDGYDVADWTDTQAQEALDRGWVCSDWINGDGVLHERPVPAAALRIVVPNDVGDCDPGFDAGMLAVLDAEINGTPLDPYAPVVELNPGDPLEGALTLYGENHGGESDIFPICATPSWGDHGGSGWTVESWLHNPPGAGSYDVAIDLVAPMEPGTYAIFFAAAWELDCGNVLSCTNWAYAGGDQWNDGYDVADWSDEQAQDAMDRGWVCSDWINGDGVLHERSVPAAAIRIVVTEQTGVEETSWSAVKALY